MRHHQQKRHLLDVRRLAAHVGPCHGAPTAQRARLDDSTLLRITMFTTFYIARASSYAMRPMVTAVL